MSRARFPSTSALPRAFLLLVLAKGSLFSYAWAEPAGLPAPAYPAPLPGVLESGLGEEVPLRLIGIDLEQRGQRIDELPPIIEGAEPLVISFYWTPLTRLASPIPLGVRFWSHDGKITRALDLTAGPESGEAPWLPDRLHRQRVEIPMRPVALAFSGRSHMTLYFRSPHAGAGNAPPLQSLPLILSPVRRGADAGDALYPEVFGEGWRSVGASFRLGNGAEIIIAVPDTGDRAVRGIGVVSAFSYGSVPQGGVACVIEPIPAEGGAVPALELISGVHTARHDYDFQAPGVQDHEKTAIVESVEADYLSAQGAPFMKHKYAGVIEAPDAFPPLRALRFRAQGEVILDVFDVVLVH